MKRLFLIPIFVLFFFSPAWADIAILPGDFALHGPTARQLLVVERVSGGRYTGQVGEGVVLSSSDENIVKVEQGVAVPVANGSATLTATRGNETSTIQVTVTGMDAPAERSFRNQVQPVLAKFGCSSGACHGAAAGKNGFILSLRGYDDVGDWRTLTRHAWGRRINPAEPSASLLVAKPTGAVPHKGGVRFGPESREFQVLAEWIAAGAPGPRDDDPRIQRIQIVPEHAILKPGDKQQVLVLAHFSDGSVQDVTAWAKYTAGDTSVANIVDETGVVNVVGHGEGPITAWYLSKLAIATVTAPYDNSPDETTYTQAPRRNFIDELVLEKLRELNLPPSPRSTDSQFIRRVFVDTVGVLPTPDETRAFLADASADKRDKLIESLLDRSEFVDYWSHKWSDLLLVSSFKLTKPAALAYYTWIRNEVAADTPWDVMVRKLVTSRGGSLENGAANFYALHDTPQAMSENVSQAFLGMSIQCAKCHNHPMEKWTNGQYYAMANLFARVRTKNGDQAGETVVFTSTTGDLTQPLTGRPMPPQPLDGVAIGLDTPGDRREHMADWLTSPDNPYFTRAIVNRVWSNFMGVGLVESVDDMRQTNPASNEKLLAALAAYTAEQGYDLKALMRTILQSETYQRSSATTAGNEGDRRFYSRYYPRRLMAEVALDAMSQVTGVPTPFQRDLGASAAQRKSRLGEAYPMGLRAIQLPDSSAFSYFLESFGRAERLQTCTCERTNEPSMAQALHIANGDTLNEKLQAKSNLIQQLLDGGADDGRVIEAAYLGALSRTPSDAEVSAITQVFTEAAAAGVSRREVAEDLFWSILSNNEFLFNH